MSDILKVVYVYVVQFGHLNCGAALCAGITPVLEILCSFDALIQLQSFLA